MIEDSDLLAASAVWWIRRCYFCGARERLGEHAGDYTGDYDPESVAMSVIDDALLKPCPGPFRLDLHSSPIQDYELDTVITGDCFDYLDRMPPGSVDMVIGDPVYNAIHHYFMVAAYAYKILKPGGSLLLQAGSAYRYDAETAARASKMEPRPLIAEHFPAATGAMYRDRTLIGWREWLWFTRPPDGTPEGKITPRRGDWIFNRFPGGGRDKSAHRWGDSIRFAFEAISRLTNPGDIVIVPFAGGGAECAAAKRAGRHFLGFEIDPGTAAQARTRLNQTAWPVIVSDPEADQLPLKFGGDNGEI